MKKLNVLITSRAGFISSHILYKYIENEYNFFVIDNISTGKINCNKEVEFIVLNICGKYVSKIFEKIKFDVINHHESQINIRKFSIVPIFDSKIFIFFFLIF